MSSIGIQLIDDERQRQIVKEGFTEEHDSLHQSGELCDAAISYAMAAAKQARGEELPFLETLAGCGNVPWPWEDEWWKPSPHQIQNLVKAGALITAEIDRLSRLGSIKEVQP